MNNGIPEPTIGRLGLYRRLLRDLSNEGAAYVYSHHLADRARSTAAQVRRDLMLIGVTGNTSKGYDVQELLNKISTVLDVPGGQKAVLVGVGNLGRALITHLASRADGVEIVASFDVDPAKAGRTLQGVPCCDLADLPQVVRKYKVDVGVITVPANQAQDVANTLFAAGIRGILNFAPTRLEDPQGAYVENLELGPSLERVAYMARQHSERGDENTNF